jgi:type IV secretory pathway VirJ component
MGFTSGPVRPTVAELRDLPLVEFPAAASSRQVFAIFITGDGGWGGLDKEMTADLAAHGVSVVGLDAHEYLHEHRTPDRVAADVERVVHYYQSKWNLARFAIVGYSRGADLAPFAVSRMDGPLRRDIALVAMIGLADHAGFEFHMEDLVRDVRRPTDLPTDTEIEKISGVPMMCVYGVEEKDSGCRNAPENLVQRIPHPGAHHFKGDFDGLSELILKALKA